MKKVIVRLGNGLGNQLFTYAAAYTFARKNNAELYVDDESGFHKRYKYELHNLNITAPIVERKYKFLGIGSKIKRKILQKINNFKKDKIFLIEEHDSNKLTFYNQKQLNINFNNRLYFEGYFQSEKYFKDESENLKEEFSFRKIITNHESSFLDKIKNNNSVSIHVRQTKFKDDEGHEDLDKLNKEFFEFNLDIIKKGINFFDKNINEPTYFVWSNDFSGLREFYPSEKFIFVDENINKDPTYDLYLMSHCKHFILSPSTFHYWGAYLSHNKDKICIAPKNELTKSGYYGFSNNKDIKAEWWREI